jgi:hypothetical protein
MTKQVKEIWERIRDHGESPSAQAANLAELAAAMLGEPVEKAEPAAEEEPAPEGGKKRNRG